MRITGVVAIPNMPHDERCDCRQPINASARLRCRALATRRQMHPHTGGIPIKIIVIGGTGQIGTQLCNNLRQQGHDFLAGAPSTGVNAVNGEGLQAALTGAEVVVDVDNSPRSRTPALEFFKKSGRNLFSAEKAAGVIHHVALSVVGTVRMLDSGYFRAKMA